MSPDGRWIAYTGYDQKNFTSHLSQPVLMDATGARKRMWVGSLPSSPSNVTWAPDGSGVYYSMQEEGEENTWFAPADQGLPPKKMTNGDARALRASRSRKNGQAAAIRSSVKQPGQLVAFSHVEAVRRARARRRQRRRARRRDARRRGRAVVHGAGRPQGAGLADEAGELRSGEEVSDGAVDSRRSVEHVQRRLELG